MRKTLMVAGLLTVGTLSPAVVVPWPSAGLLAQQAATMKVTLKVTGMTCAGCTTAVKLAAKRVEGVTNATASYEKGTAEITYDSAKTSPDAIAKAVTEKSGFKAEVQKKQKS
jgi:mercuric ion binding protein